MQASDFQAVPGNDPRLAQFLVQKDIDAAALRTMTLALLPDTNFKKIGSFREMPARLMTLTKALSTTCNSSISTEPFKPSLLCWVRSFEDDSGRITDRLGSCMTWLVVLLIVQHDSKSGDL